MAYSLSLGFQLLIMLKELGVLATDTIIVGLVLGVVTLTFSVLSFVRFVVSLRKQPFLAGGGILEPWWKLQKDTGRWERGVDGTHRYGTRNKRIGEGGRRVVTIKSRGEDRNARVYIFPRYMQRSLIRLPVCQFVLSEHADCL